MTTPTPFNEQQLFQKFNELLFSNYLKNEKEKKELIMLFISLLVEKEIEKALEKNLTKPLIQSIRNNIAHGLK